jgi:hypothetical protein
MPFCEYTASFIAHSSSMDVDSGDQEEEEEEEALSKLREVLRQQGYTDVYFRAAPGDNVEDIPVIASAPPDMRRLFVRLYLALSLRELGNAPICSGAAKLMWMASRWRSLDRAMNSDDSIWAALFERDFAPFGERAHEWTLGRPMPWRSAYLWTVFLRRRCLREMAIVAWNVHPRALRSIPFGQRGSVCAIEKWIGMPSPSVKLDAYCSVSRYESSLTFVSGMSLESRHALLEGLNAVHGDRRFGMELDCFPAKAMIREVAAIAQRQYIANTRVPPPSLREMFRRLLLPTDKSLARFVEWNYADAIYAYASAGVTSPGQDPTPFEAEDLVIFASLPDYPNVKGRVYLGERVHI